MYNKEDKFIIGDKHAFQHSYERVVGQVCSWQGVRDSESSYVKVPVTGSWYILNEDLLPMNMNNSEAAHHLLKRD